MSEARCVCPDYVRPDFSFSSFPFGARVADVGCGEGRHLAELAECGCQPVGVEIDPSLVALCRANGHEVVEGPAESLPFVDRSVDGIVCCIVVPYTDERKAVAEWARVLVPAGEVRASFISLGYALRFLLGGPSLRHRFYGLRMILNTAAYRLTGKRLPGFLGDTLYQSPRQLAKYYARFGLRLVNAPRVPTYLGLSVLIYHHLEKV
jgi:SAM-dependent methyltransferase